MESLGMFILWLFAIGMKKSSSTTPSIPSAPATSDPAEAAKRAADAARNDPTPKKLEDAAEAAKRAADAAEAAKRASKAASRVPAPWPAAMPVGLPPYPAGWEADVPPPKEVVARAWQLLPELHKYGVGTKKTEYVGGRWITFVAQMHGTKKGVTAFRVKGSGVKRAAA
jgi:hypothetical protein